MVAQPTPKTPEVINRHWGAVFAPMAMLAGMQLELFTPLQNGPMNAEALAETLGLNPVKLSPLLYALVVAELLTFMDGRFANTPEAEHFLVKGRPAYIGGAHELLSELWSAVLHTAETIRTGKPQAKIDFDAMDEERLRAFLRGSHGGAVATGRMLAERLNLADCKHLADVGGGSGGLAIGACEASPGLRATVVDLPGTIKITKDFIGESAVAGRVGVNPADVTKERPEGTYDIAVLRYLIQVISAEQARRTIQHVGQTLEPGGRIAIVGRMLDDSRLSPPEVVTFNLVFLNIYDDGVAYTEQEHRDWLAEAGFAEFDRQALPDGSTMVTARKA